MNQQLIKIAVQDATAILRGNLTAYTDFFMDSNTIGNLYPKAENLEWTTGFCTGEYWLCYELSGEQAFRESAEVQVKNFLHRIQNKIEVNHHDMGFLYSPSCVAAYRLTGSETGKQAALLAADNLLARFQEKGQFFQAWGELGAADNYRLIIDCLLNLPLLFWASETTGNPVYAEKATRHMKTSLQNLVRADNSTYHTYFFDRQTGEPSHGVTHQGYRDGSAWARGQAWGIYGTALSYRYTKDPACLDLFRRVTDFFLAKLPSDSVPYWDLEFSDGDQEPKDSSASAIAVCGIFEMAKYLPADEAAHYTQAAETMLTALISDYAVKTPQEGAGLLLHGVYAKNSPFNPIPQDRGVDECNTWGDYFYLEALTRCTKDWQLYW